jgi:hypothetical protein
MVVVPGACMVRLKIGRCDILGLCEIRRHGGGICRDFASADLCGELGVTVAVEAGEPMSGGPVFQACTTSLIRSGFLQTPIVVALAQSDGLVERQRLIFGEVRPVALAAKQQRRALPNGSERTSFAPHCGAA